MNEPTFVRHASRRRLALGFASAAVSAGILLVSATGASAAPNPASAVTPSLGYDISWPQCGKPLPTGQEFGIVGVNDGLANTSNPCFTEQLKWAEASPGGSGQPSASLYVNTANPGLLSASWPTSNRDSSGSRIDNPYGTCAGADDAACAYMYGWIRAEEDATIRNVVHPESYRWWLDVETENTWSSNTRANTADLEGMASYFIHIGADVGLYSTPYQWKEITGTSVSSASVLAGLPNWIALGRATEAEAKAGCSTPAFTPKSSVSIVQYLPSGSPFDNNFACTTVVRTPYVATYSVSSATVGWPSWLAPCDDIAAGACGPEDTKVTALTASGSVTWNDVQVDSTGLYAVTIRYSNGWNTALAADVSTGSTHQTVSFPPVAGAGAPNKAVGTRQLILNLTAGKNTIRIAPPAQGDAPEIVGIAVTPAVTG